MTTPPRILLLEDDPAIAQTVAFSLRREGFGVDQVLLVAEAERHLQAMHPALAILDVGLPDGSGLELCRRLRHGALPGLHTLPVLMLTARGEEIDRVLGLELGADDYLAKPFSPRELVARVRALLRRAAMTAPVEPAPAARFELDAAGQRVRYAGRWLTLTRQEFRLLRALLAAPRRIHSRDALLSAAWGGDSEAGDRTVDSHVKTLRAKLREAAPQRDAIVTHRGLGYSLADDD